MPLRITQEEFLIKARQVHGNKYNYSASKYTGSNKKVTIICKIHGMFDQNANAHLNGRGCKACGRTAAANKISMSIDSFLTKAIHIHDGKYNYSKIKKIKNSKDEITIICSAHGEFIQTISVHLQGKGCQTCSGNKRLQTSEFVERANQIHDNKYDYKHSVYVNGKAKVKIICPTHGSFEQQASSHLCGHGCFKCANSIHKAENGWLNYTNLAPRHRQKSIKINGKLFKVDGYNPKTNTIYEFYGDFWHGNPDIYAPDNINPLNKESFGDLYDKTIKRELELKKAGYDLAIIWESSWKKIIKNNKNNDLENRPKTLICDIDGTLIKHKGDITTQHLAEPELLFGVLEFWKKIDRAAWKIVLITGRRESVRKSTEEQLNRLGIFYDVLIMGATSGQRVLINDRKPTGGFDTAIAINLERNEGLKEVKI